MIEGMLRELCSGCGACYAICPVQAISMRQDNEGFYYPQIDKSRCINCKKCVRVCPVLSTKTNAEIIPKAVVCAAKDAMTRKNSTSGGFFAELSKYIINRGGVVFGVEFDENFLPHHCAIEHKEDLFKLCRSKYIQSNIYDTYGYVRKLLDEQKLVLFSGTPCQIAGVKRYLKADYNNLITCDVVCRGVMSPRIWKKYLDELEEKFHSKISYVGFREKGKSFHKSRLVIRFRDGKTYAPSTDVEWISRLFSDGLSLRPSCYRCSFKGFERASDFTMFDCWNVERLVPGVVDDDKGYTNVLLHSQKANTLFEKMCSQLNWWKIDAESAKHYDGIMLFGNVTEPDKRAELFKDVDIMTIENLGKKYSPIPFKIILKEYLKVLLVKLHVLKL